MMTIIVKLVHDLLLNKLKLILCILAAALSSWGISSFVYSYSLTTRDFEVNFLSTNPSDLAITVHPVSDSLLESIRHFPEIKEIETRDVLVGRIRSFNGWVPVTLYGVADFNNQKLNTINKDENLQINNSGVFIEQNAVMYLDPTEPHVTIKFSETDSLVLTKNGTVHDPGQAPAQMEGIVYAYTSIENLNKHKLLNSQRLLIKTNLSNPAQEDLVKFGKQLSDHVKTAGGEVLSLVIPPWNEHPHQGIVDGIAFLQKTFGIVLSVLGIILLSLILSTWIFPQLPHVGIMKALGAQVRSILGAFLFVISIILFLGMGVGIPLGYLSAEKYAGFIALLQNFSGIESLLPMKNHLTVILLCTLIPIIFSLSMLVAVSRSSVNHALTNTFQLSRNLLFRFQQHVLQSTPLKYAANSLWRNFQRSALLILLMSTGLTLFFTGRNLEHSIQTDFSRSKANSNYQVVANLASLYSKPLDFLDSISFVKGYAVFLGERIQFQSKKKGFDESTFLFTYPPNYVFDEKSLTRGMLDKNCINCFYVNQRLTSDFEEVQLGDSVKFTRKDGSTFFYRFAGIVRNPIGNGMYRLSGSQLPAYNFVGITIDKDGSEIPLNSIESALRNNDFKVTSVIADDSLFLGLANHLAPTYLVLKYAGIITAIISLFGLLIVINLTIQERKLEMGILKSIGCSGGKIVEVIRNEFLMISIVAIILGLFLMSVTTTQLAKVYGIGLLGAGFPVTFEWRTIVISISILLIVQALLISGYCYFKILRTARELITDVG